MARKMSDNIREIDYNKARDLELEIAALEGQLAACKSGVDVLVLGTLADFRQFSKAYPRAAMELTWGNWVKGVELPEIVFKELWVGPSENWDSKTGGWKDDPPDASDD